MQDPQMLTLLYLVLGLLIGALSSWLIAKFHYRARMLAPEEVSAKYVDRQFHDHLQRQADLCRDDLLEKEEEMRRLSARIASRDQTIGHLEDQLHRQKEEIGQLQERFQLEFENIANRLLEEKSRKFTDQNQQQLHNLLTPLKERIKAFEEGVEKRYLQETHDRVSLKKEIEQLRDLNLQLSQDAANLTSALKGDQKLQGDWGEMQLETLLEKAGLQKGVHYQVQTSFRDADGRQKRPDFIINLPDDKHLIIDSKVSLTAYERYFNAESNTEKQQHLRAHLESIRSHIRQLSRKNYQELYQINSPDYLMLFIPLEPAFAIALQEDQRLFVDALEQNIVPVTTSTLLATLRTVAFIWKQEKQKRSVQEIARQSGLLYDKFCGFVEDLRAIGLRIEHTQSAYADAMNKLVDSKKFGDTLIGRAERIKTLGARNTKQLPKELLDPDSQMDNGYPNEG